jgi:catechol 2,3-dioxygenase-like lactoylglutathione lyase family enzyme
MLTDRPLHPIVIVRDVPRARAFYEGKLGLRACREEPETTESVVLDGGKGTKLALERRDVPQPSVYTALTFEVEDLRQEVEDLERRGVEFLPYQAPNDLKAKWFADPDGNILCLHQRN